jgi:hypothetical protein
MLSLSSADFRAAAPTATLKLPAAFVLRAWAPIDVLAEPVLLEEQQPREVFVRVVQPRILPAAVGVASARLLIQQRPLVAVEQAERI